MMVMGMTIDDDGVDKLRYDSQRLTTRQVAATAISSGKATAVVEPLHRSVVHEHTSCRPPKPDRW